MEETTNELEDANSQIFNICTEGVFCSYDLSGKMDRLQHSVESLLAYICDSMHTLRSRFDRLENVCKRATPEAFLTTMEETTKEHEEADSTIFDALEDVLPNHDLFNRLQHTVDILEAYIGKFVKSMVSRVRNLRIRVRPYVVLAVEQIKTRAQGCKQQDIQ